MDSYRQAHPDPLTHLGYTRQNWAGQRSSTSRINGVFISRNNIDKINIEPELKTTISDHAILQIGITKANTSSKPKTKHPVFNDYFLGQAFNRDIFKRITKEETYAHKTNKEVPISQYEPKHDPMEDVNDPAGCYIKIVERIVKFSTDQMRGIKVHQHSKVNILNHPIRELELRFSTLSHTEKVNLHDLYANLQELKREESKREIESRHLNSDLHDQVGSAKFFKWQKDTDYQTEIKSLKIDGTLTNDKEVIDIYVRNHYARRFTKTNVTRVYT